VGLEELFPSGDCPLVAELDANAGQIFGMDEQAAKVLRDQSKGDNFKFDQKQMDEFKQQMEEFRKDFKSDEFKFDQKQLDEMKQRMEEFRNSFDSEDLQAAPI
jgi:hypothetical protein